jgi:class 3 adenylate cyclase
LFADIKGSTELISDLDPEDARALVDPVLRLMIEAVHRYEGYVAQSTGDGIFALFGAPLAYEDHPQRALHAALAMQRAIHEHATRLAAQGRPAIEARQLHDIFALQDEIVFNSRSCSEDGFYHNARKI